MIMLDTQALIWVDQDAEGLGAETKKLIATALDRNELGVSTISFWEIASLMRIQRIEMEPGISVWRRDLMDAGLREIPVNGLIGIPGDDEAQGEFLSTAGVAARDVAPSLSSTRDSLISTPPHLLVSLIVGTAIRLGATLVTTDEHLLRWPGKLDRHDARN